MNAFKKLSTKKGLACLKLAIPFLCFTLLLFYFFATFVLAGGDEAFYGAVLGNENLFSFLRTQYLTWSSRTLIELLLCLIAAAPHMLWRIVTPFIILALAYLLCRLLQIEHDILLSSVACIALFLYPWWNLSTAGWIATTVNYLYPFVSGLLALYLALYTTTTRYWHWCIALPAMLFAANAEQCAVFFCLTLGTVLVYQGLTHTPFVRLTLALFCTTLCGIFYALLSPGAHRRTETETTSFFLDFEMHSILSRAEIGMTKGFYAWLLNRDYILVLLCLFLTIVIWQWYRNWLYRIIPIALTAVSLFSCFFWRTFAAHPLVQFFTNAYYAASSVGVHNCNNPFAYIPLFAAGCFYIALLLCLYLAFGHSRTALIAIAAMLFGFASLGMIGFSPTVGVSSLRTSFIFNMCVIFVFVLLAKEHKETLWRARWVLLPALCYCCAIQCISLWEI